MFFDTHAHYDDDAFDLDRDALLSSMAAGGVELIVDPASDLRSAEKAKGIAEKYDFVYFAAGVHPNEAQSCPEDYLQSVRRLLRHPKCVAVGEIGLDYHYGSEYREKQKRLFREQLELAREEKMPVIVHERESVADLMAIISDFSDLTGVVHCFSGSLETARAILSLGWYISFTGVVTFKNARRAAEAAAVIPIDRLMIETDSPYMAPEPVRGTRNSSLNLVHIARRVAELRGISAEELARLTLENGRRFFRI